MENETDVADEFVPVDSEYVNLDETLAKYIHPRLKHFLEHYVERDSDEYEQMHDVVMAFEALKTPWHVPNLPHEERDAVERGLHAFADMFLRLWS